MNKTDPAAESRPARKKRRPKQDDNTATMRRIAMLQMLPTWPKTISTAEVHDKLAAADYIVERRTVQRDLGDLSAIFRYSSETRGKAHHWFWPADGAAISIRSISPEAALVLNLAERELQGLLPDAALKLLEPYFRQAREALDGDKAPPLARWKDKLQVIPRGPVFQKPIVAPGVQSAIFEALLADRQIEAVYRSRSSEAAKETVLHPLGIVSRHGVIYLVATAWQYKDPFHYALHRFTEVTVTDEASLRPGGFRLDSYVRDSQAFDLPTGEGSIRVKLEVAADTAVALLERPLSADQTARQLNDERYRIEATVQDTMELRWWLLGLGPNVKVIGPARLRQDVVEALEEARGQYG